ncbi:MAG TPA: hypothetical protein VFE12_13810, partial [Acetobacteraceae bacterium]|nr:hypothetical protein [Acetobacteraceae bacterium]
MSRITLPGGTTMNTVQRFGIRRVLFAAAVVIAVLPALAQTPARRAFTPGDWYSVKTLSAPVMSPDGKYVAVQVTNVIEAKNTRMNEIWVASTAPGAGEPQRFTAPGFDSTNPSFSTDSSLLIFNSTRPGYTATRWAVKLDGPGGEFEHPTLGGPAGQPDAAGGDFANPGGRAGGPGANLNSSTPKDNSFTVSTGVPGGAVTGAGRTGGGGAARGGGGAAARGGAAPGAPPAPTAAPAAAAGTAAAPARTTPASSTEAYAAMPPMAKPPAGAITLPLDPSRFDGMQIIDTRFKANGRGFVPSTGTTLAGRGAGPGGAGAGGGRAGGAGPESAPTQVLIDKKDGTGAQPLTSTLYSHREARVSPDGKWIVFAADAELRPDTELRAVRDEIAKLGTDAARATATREKLQTELYLMPTAGGTAAPKRIRTSGNETGVAWSSDSRWFTFTANAGANTNTNIYLADATTGVSKSLTSDLRTDGGPTTWLPNGDLLMQVNVGGRNALYRISPRTGDRKEIVGGRRRVFGFTY